MPESKKTVIWDFDGTLALRPLFWSGTMIEVLDEFCPGHEINVEQVRKYMKSVYPWDTPETPHPHLSAPGAWWAQMERIIANAYKAVGTGDASAVRFARLFRERYTDPRGFVLYDDTVSTLEYFTAHGWNSIILSNHVPELEEIAKGLSIGKYFSACISSANTGYEKPHPEAFKIALCACGWPETVWMVGDNIKADIEGAQGLGIPAVLVHTPDPGTAGYHADTLAGLAEIIR